MIHTFFFAAPASSGVPSTTSDIGRPSTVRPSSTTLACGICCTAPRNSEWRSSLYGSKYALWMLSNSGVWSIVSICPSYDVGTRNQLSRW